MDVMEKMVELLTNSPQLDVLDWTTGWEEAANYLIAHGVMVQEWISVDDRLPEPIPCDAGTAYSEAVNVLTTGRKVLTAIWDGTDFIADAEFWEAEDEEITHWTPVLLPQPPKVE